MRLKRKFETAETELIFKTGIIVPYAKPPLYELRVSLRLDCYYADNAYGQPLLQGVPQRPPMPFSITGQIPVLSVGIFFYYLAPFISKNSPRGTNQHARHHTCSHRSQPKETPSNVHVQCKETRCSTGSWHPSIHFRDRLSLRHVQGDFRSLRGQEPERQR